MYSPRFKSIHLFVLLLPLFGIAQYTDVINSNRPGVSIGAYSVGSNVVQLETGLNYEEQNHSLLNTDATILSADVLLRYGVYFETLEFMYEGTYTREKTTFELTSAEATRNNFSRNRVGLKFLVFDPYKSEKRNKPNLYSWRANNVFQLKNLIPAVSIYGGANFNLTDNPFYPQDPSITYRGMIATQSKLTPRTVLTMNFAYDRITSDDPEMSYIVSLSRSLRNPKWSIFIENQGIKSDLYADAIIRGGTAYLFNETMQVDVNFGGSFKTTPSRFFASLGFSYRLDFHKDRLLPAKDNAKGLEGGKIKKNDAKKKKKGKKKKKNKLDF